MCPGISSPGCPARGLLASACCRGAWFVFPGMAGVLHCGDCADGPLPVVSDAITREGGVTDAGVSELGCILYVRAMARVFFFRIFNLEVQKPWGPLKVLKT